uniref:Uncharacterized protein n=1 Tax=uncultured marine virus TaxID=186617 RepID=A0A0F7L9F0_9VIRU|nr:hypothetical protein [uncultured marine virus]
MCPIGVPINRTDPSLSDTAGLTISVHTLGDMMAYSSITTLSNPIPRILSGLSAPKICIRELLNRSILNSVSFLPPPYFIKGAVYCFKYSQAIDLP